MPVLESRVPPPAVALIAAILMWVAARAVPAFAMPASVRLLLAGAFVAAGVATAGAGLAAFRRAGTTSDPTRPGAASSLVLGGPYRFSRNPMYLGVLLVLVGWAVYLSNVLAFVVLPVFVLYLNRYQIAPEERALSARFGASFDEYRKSVRRWL